MSRYLDEYCISCAFREGKPDEKAASKTTPAESVAKKQSELLQSVTKTKELILLLYN